MSGRRGQQPTANGQANNRLPPGDRRQDVHLSPGGHGLVQAERFFAVDREEDFGAQANVIDDSAGERRVLALEVRDQRAQRCARGFDRVRAAHEGAQHGEEMHGGHAAYFSVPIVSRSRLGDIGSWCWRTPVAR